MSWDTTHHNVAEAWANVVQLFDRETNGGTSRRLLESLLANFELAVRVSERQDGRCNEPRYGIPPQSATENRRTSLRESAPDRKIQGGE